MKEKGILTVISGFSGAGKGTVVKSLLEQEDYSLSISATTRKKRAGEEHGREYFFLTRQEFESMIEQNELIEWAEYVDHYYGTPRAYVEQCLAEGKDVILEIELQGAFRVKELFPEALLLFLTPPSVEELKKRLAGRGTETPEVIERRIRRAKEESEFIERYDYLVVNDNLDDCVKQVHGIIRAAKAETGRNRDLAEKLKRELLEYQE